MRSLPGINEAIILCHRGGRAREQQHPRALSPVSATARGCATIYFPLRYTRCIARTVVQLALDEIGITRWHNARDTTSQLRARGPCIIIVIDVVVLVVVFFFFLSHLLIFLFPFSSPPRSSCSSSSSSSFPVPVHFQNATVTRCKRRLVDVRGTSERLFASSPPVD